MRYYKRKRIVNINANIVIASVLGTILAAYPVYLTRFLTNNEIAIVLLSFVFDAIIDFVFFATLHLAVHKAHVSRFKPSKIIVKDLLKIQIQRGILSVLYLVVAVGGHFVLLMAGVERTVGFLVAYLAALVITRSVHTVYGNRTGLFKEIDNNV